MCDANVPYLTDFITIINGFPLQHREHIPAYVETSLAILKKEQAEYRSMLSDLITAYNNKYNPENPITGTINPVFGYARDHLNFAQSLTNIMGEMLKDMDSQAHNANNTRNYTNLLKNLRPLPEYLKGFYNQAIIKIGSFIVKNPSSNQNPYL